MRTHLGGRENCYEDNLSNHHAYMQRQSQIRLAAVYPFSVAIQSPGLDWIDDMRGTCSFVGMADYVY